MAPKTKFLVTIFGTWLCAMLIGVVWLITDREWIVYSLFVWLPAATWLAGRVVCPVCNTPVAYSVKAGRIRILSAIPRNTCSECGHDLTKP